MNLKNKSIVFKVALVLAAGLILFWGYSTFTLIQKKNALALELESEQDRYKALQRKYAEQKAQMAATQRAKLAAEGGLRQARQDLQAEMAEKETLADELAGLEEKYSQKTAKLEAHIEKYKEQLAKLVENRDQYKAKLTETVAVVKERNQMIHKLTAERDELTADLLEKTATLTRCVKHNARLSVLSEELVMAFENKGVGASIMQAEPLTGLKKVEVEKLVQQYRDRIDNDNLELINSHQK